MHVIGIILTLIVVLIVAGQKRNIIHMPNELRLYFGGNLYPVPVDSDELHEGAIVIESTNRRMSFGLNRNKEIEDYAAPFYARELTLKKAKEIRDELNRLIKDIESESHRN